MADRAVDVVNVCQHRMLLTSILRVEHSSESHVIILLFFFFSSRRRHTRFDCDWSSDVCSSDLAPSPRATKNGSPPTPLKARTGLFTPPGMSRVAASNNRFESLMSRVSRSSARSEERRVGKECRSRWSPYH